MRSIKSMMMGGAILLGLSMCFTSCEGALDDILGEWSRPTPGGGSSSDETTPTMKATPLTFEVLTDGNITVAKPRAGMYYKKNGGDQVALTAGVDASIDVTKDDKVEFYGTATSYFNNWSDYTTFGGTAQVNVYGNIMSLLSPTGFADNEMLTANYTFQNLFEGYTNLKDASNLFLPATTLAQGCYVAMFNGCTNLTTAPALPAKSLAPECYGWMFAGCSSLTTAPALPAETLTSSCYYEMFLNCTNLKDAYVKAAYVNTTAECYDMFGGCPATGAKLHTTSDHKASWTGNVPGNWEIEDDWTD